MPHPLGDEIASYLSHHDYSLAVRRMLDFSMDTGDEKLIHESIAWSKSYRLRKSRWRKTVAGIVFCQCGKPAVEPGTGGKKDAFRKV